MGGMSKSAQKILDLRNVGFIADKPVLKNINWTVYDGERWALLGANGSGKSSLILTICAYNTPSSGNMAVDGGEYSACNWQDTRRKIALVGEDLRRRIDPTEKVVEVIIGGKFAQINYRGRITRPLVMEAYGKMLQLGIERLIDSEWAHISQGERQKVLLARALMLKPSVVFLDEPCSGLDPVARREFIKFLDSLCSDRSIPAIVMATHYVEEIPRAFSHAIIMKNGGILASGEIAKVLNSKNLSKAYGTSCKLSKHAGSFSLKIL